MSGAAQKTDEWFADKLGKVSASRIKFFEAQLMLGIMTDRCPHQAHHLLKSIRKFGVTLSIGPMKRHLVSLGFRASNMRSLSSIIATSTH